MKVSAFLSGLLFLFTTALFGQGNYQPGYVVENNGDTLRGLIDYKAWDRSPLIISFRESDQSTVLEYQPANIKSFSVSGEYYESGMVDVDTSPAELGELDESPLPKYVHLSVFMQSLFRGEKRLLFFQDQNFVSHFFITDEGKFVPLIYKRYISDPMNQRVAENTGYKKRLALYFNDCADIQSKLADTGYNSKSLVNLFKYYYKCTNKTTQYANERKETKMNFGLIGGITLTTLKFDGPDFYDYMVKATWSESTNIALGFYLDFSLLRSTRFKISNQFLYTSFNVKGSGYTNDFPGYSTDATFNYQYFKSHHMLQYSLTKNGSLYVSAGPSLGFVLGHEAKINLIYSTGTVSEKPFTSKSYEFGYAAGIGMRKDKLTIEVKYEDTTSITDYPADSKTIRGYLLVGYRISGGK